jgi:hypothetical protein
MKRMEIFFQKKPTPPPAPPCLWRITSDNGATEPEEILLGDGEELELVAPGVSIIVKATNDGVKFTQNGWPRLLFPGEDLVISADPILHPFHKDVVLHITKVER